MSVKVSLAGSLAGLALAAGLSVAGASLAQQAAAPVAAPPLVAHRATYVLTLANSQGAQGPSAARGKITFDFSGTSCEGYVQKFEQFTEVQPAEGPTRVSTLHSATFEDGAGKNFRFRTKTDNENAPSTQVDGKALKSDDGALSVSLTRPKQAKLDLDKNILFPTAHLARVLELARANQKILETKVYDGSDTGDKVYDTIAVIGREIAAPAPEKAAQSDALKGVKRWPVSISYFEEGKKDSEPLYSMAFDLYDNGVSRALKLDYGAFVLAGEMTEFEALPSKQCAK